MNRREAFKKIGLTTGFVVLTPSMMQLFQSCAKATPAWSPVFLSVEQGMVLKRLADVFLPKSETPSASEVGVPEFIDRYFDEVYDLDEQKRVKMAFDLLIAEMKAGSNVEVDALTEGHYKEILDREMLLDQANSNPSEPMSISELLNSLKWMTINGYRISEIVGEQILAYDPVPGTYLCDDLQKLTKGKAWSL